MGASPGASDIDVSPGRSTSTTRPSTWRRARAPVVLLHGFPDSGRMWRHQVRALADAGFMVIVPDLRGYGTSAEAPEGVEAYSMLNAAGDVRRHAATSWASDGPTWSGTTSARPRPGPWPPSCPTGSTTWSPCRSGIRWRSAPWASVSSRSPGTPCSSGSSPRGRRHRTGCPTTRGPTLRHWTDHPGTSTRSSPDLEANGIPHPGPQLVPGQCPAAGASGGPPHRVASWGAGSPAPWGCGGSCVTSP